VIFKLFLPSVGEKTPGKELFAECCICDTRQRALCRVSKKDTRQRNSLPSVKNKTLGKELLRRVFYFTEGFLRGTRQRALCRVPEIKHSVKNMTLGKEPNSGSVGGGPAQHTTYYTWRAETAAINQFCLNQQAMPAKLAGSTLGPK
jgi:hypothetical protein